VFSLHLVCPWKFCGMWLYVGNYCSVLYALLVAVFIIDLLSFFDALLKRRMCEFPEAALQPWLKFFMWPIPFVIAITIGCCILQSLAHAKSIRRGAATLKHDRAVQILVLPSLYAVVAMGALTQVLHLTVSDVHREAEWKQLTMYTLSRSGTFYIVAELYEAWALYQFGKLTLETLHEFFVKQESSDDEEQRAAARSFLLAHSAVENLTWMGTWMFLIVCVAKACWALWLFGFHTASIQGSAYETHMLAFEAAGFVASGTAIYNVAVVEHTFGRHLEFFSPLTKFLSVKLLVSLSFTQTGIISVLQAFYHSVPTRVEHYFDSTPVIGTLMKLSDIQMQLMTSSLIVYECLLITCIHWWAWNPNEGWYEDVPLHDGYGSLVKDA